MPIVTVPSGSARIHSWLSAYFRSLGTFMRSPGLVRSTHQHLAVARERRLHHFRGEHLVAHCYLYRIADGDVARHARERDRLAERGAERSTRDLAFAVRGVHFLVRAEHPA